MPVHDVGNIRFKKFRAGSFLPPLQAMHTFDCHPPPQGSTRSYNPSSEYQPVILADYLQNAEIDRIVEGAAAGAVSLPQFQDIWDGAMQGLDIKPLTLDLSKIPADWLKVEQCRVNEIYFEVSHKVWQIVVAAHVAVTLGGVNYPKGDAVGAFRICEPHEYRFVKLSSHSERCCPDTPAADYPRQDSQWWPQRYTWTNWATKYPRDKMDMSLQGQYYFDREIEQQWGED